MLRRGKTFSTAGIALKGYQKFIWTGTGCCVLVGEKSVLNKILGMLVRTETVVKN